MMSTPDTQPLTAHPKVCAIHLQRLAYVYVRQSSPKQVAQNLESQRLQYQLAQRAEELGWRSEQVRIIDEDQGLSGKESAGRDGFQDLVAVVSLGQVGIIFGYQVSRLARNNADWYHLLDLAAVFDTLIADADGVYNLRNYNDRLILGLKGTMSEAELHWLRQRLDDGRMSKVRRGEYHQMLPTGLVRLDDGTVIQHPDDQVRHTIELVFQKFEELGSCGKVMRYLRRADILLPREQHSGPCLWPHTRGPRPTPTRPAQQWHYSVPDGRVAASPTGCLSSLYHLGAVSGQPGTAAPGGNPLCPTYHLYAWSSTRGGSALAGSGGLRRVRSSLEDWL
jgi:DNA invertase Pin-like site-specific DNA recombinase